MAIQQHLQLFTTYIDSDYTEDTDSGHFTNGFIIKIGYGAVVWSSKLQGPVAKSSTEAEFYSTSFVGTEVKWLHHFLRELRYKINIPTPLHVDNQSTIQVLNDAVHHSHMKYINTIWFWICEEIVHQKTITVIYMPTKELMADMMTKPLAPYFIDKHHLEMRIW